LRIISLKRIKEFIDQHADSKASLLAWHDIMKAGVWNNFAELKTTFGSADIVGRRTVFDIAHNKYRLIARVNYEARKVFVLHIVTHKTYGKMDLTK
jgi:mRNA interferase HigB